MERGKTRRRSMGTRQRWGRGSRSLGWSARTFGSQPSGPSEGQDGAGRKLILVSAGVARTARDLGRASTSRSSLYVFSSCGPVEVSSPPSRSSASSLLTSTSSTYVSCSPSCSLLITFPTQHPRLTNGDPAGSWREMEALQKEGLAKSIAVSNFQISDLEALRLAGLSTPVVNQVRSLPLSRQLANIWTQILLHPYVFAQTAELLAYHATHGIVTEAYSTLIPLTKQPGGPVDVILKEISERRRVSPAQVLFAWARSKGAVIVTWVPVPLKNFGKRADEAWEQDKQPEGAAPRLPSRRRLGALSGGGGRY